MKKIFLLSIIIFTSAFNPLKAKENNIKKLIEAEEAKKKAPLSTEELRVLLDKNSLPTNEKLKENVTNANSNTGNNINININTDKEKESEANANNIEAIKDIEVAQIEAEQKKEPVKNNNKWYVTFMVSQTEINDDFKAKGTGEADVFYDWDWDEIYIDFEGYSNSEFYQICQLGGFEECYKDSNYNYGINLNSSNNKDMLNNGYDLAVGYQLLKFLRLEAELSYSKLNLNYDIPDFEASAVEQLKGNILLWEFDNSNTFVYNPYNSNDLKGNLNMESYTGMVNAIFDIPIDSGLVPYIGIGAGYSSIKTEKKEFVDLDLSGFAFQGIAGLSVKFSDTAAFVFEYTYRSVSQDLEDDDDNYYNSYYTCNNYYCDYLENPTQADEYLTTEILSFGLRANF